MSLDWEINFLYLVSCILYTRRRGNREGTMCDVCIHSDIHDGGATGKGLCVMCAYIVIYTTEGQQGRDYV